MPLTKHRVAPKKMARNVMSFFFKIIWLGNETGIQPCFYSLGVRDSQFHGQTASLSSFPIWISIGVTQKLQSIIRTLTGVNPT